ncbi:hypothetical protein ILUMI_05962, partial [Ignelater luminosus]
PENIKKEEAFVCSNTSNWKKGCNKHLIVRKYRHSKYNYSEVDYDIGLVRVKTPFNGKFEKPIKWAGSNHEVQISEFYILVYMVFVENLICSVLTMHK